MTPPTAHELGLRYRAERRAERELIREMRDTLLRVCRGDKHSLDLVKEAFRLLEGE